MSDERWWWMNLLASDFWLRSPESMRSINRGEGEGGGRQTNNQPTLFIYLLFIFFLLPSSFNSTSIVLHAKTRSKKTTRGDQTLVMIRNSPDGLYSTWYSALGTQLNDGQCTGTHWHTHLRKAITPNKIKIIIKIRKNRSGKRGEVTRMMNEWWWCVLNFTLLY